MEKAKTGNALVRIQQISVLYMVIWTISPFMEIDNIWRFAALGAFVLWLGLSWRILYYITVRLSAVMRPERLGVAKPG